MADKYRGQMWPEERRFLFEAVLESKPELAIEIGTWKGGGSTLQIVNAMRTIGRGVLHSCEIDLEFYSEALTVFQGSSRIKIYNIGSTEFINLMLSENKIPDFVFFDGPEDSELNLSDFQLLEPHLKVGARFCMHDWDLTMRPDKLISIKATLIRPYIEQSPNWKILRTLTTPASVGLVLVEKIK